MKTHSFLGRRLTAVSVGHYIQLFYRAALFLAALTVYIVRRVKGLGTMLDFAEKMPVMLGVIWVVFMVEMAFRFFPSRLASPGSEKQFAQHYVPTGETKPALHDNNAAVLVMLIWIAFNGLFGALYQTGVFDEDIMLLICLAYSVCDMICILFFCPFQTWFLKNKCCGSCRIYNWDYAMMFTPLFFVPRVYTWSLLAAAAALLIRWEITVYRHPERFSEKTNGYLRCAVCTEKLCTHKTQLRTLWEQLKREERRLEERLRLPGKKESASDPAKKI